MRVLYQDEFTKKFREGNNLIHEHVSGARITSMIDPEWSDQEVAKRYGFKLRLERSKREDKCSDPNHKQELGKITCDTCFEGLKGELQMLGLNI